MSEFKIEKNVPFPDRIGCGRLRIYPFPNMKVGDSFDLQDRKPASVRSSASHYVRRLQPTWKFSICKDRQGRYRCWRVK